MKKRIFAICVIVLCLLTFCILEEILVNNTLTSMEQKAENIFVIAESGENVNTQELYDLTKDLNDFWLENENLLCFFINHKDMHEMGNELNHMTSYCDQNLKDEFIASLNLVKYYTMTFHHIMGVSLQNII